MTKGDPSRYYCCLPRKRLLISKIYTMANTTMGVYKTHAEAEQAIKELVAFGVKDNDISYIYTDSDVDMTDAQSGEKVGAGAAEPCLVLPRAHFLKAAA